MEGLCCREPCRSKVTNGEGIPDVRCGHRVGNSGLDHRVRRLTSDPADLFGIRDRGRLKPGLAADIAIFDPATVGSSNRGERRYDLPGGGKSMVMLSRWVRYTIVNGVTTYADGELIGAAAGKVLRS